MGSKKRIMKELNDINKGISENISLGPKDGDNLYEWTAIINGPKDTPFEGGIFKLDIILPSNYPFKSPEIKFKTKMYHPNIDSEGNICLDILKDKWSPALSISSTLLSICSLLTDPNSKDPLNVNAADVYDNDKEKYNKKVRDYTRRYAN